MTEIALPAPAGDVEASAQSPVQRFAADAAAVFQVAKVLCQTSFVPKHFQNKPYECTAAILFGAELGIPQMAALQTVHVIEGRPTLTAVAMRGMAIAAGVQFELAEATDTRCVYRAKAPGAKEWTESEWTIDRARALNLLNKPNWKNQPKAMLIARATTELCRLVAANLFIGCPYSAEEMNDLGGAGGEQPPAKRTVRRKPAAAEPAPFAEPEIDPAAGGDGDEPVEAT